MLSPQEKNDRLWATLMHLATFSGYVIPVPGMTVLGPLALWLIKRHDSPFLEDQGKEAVNFNLSFLLYLFLAGLSMLVLIGWILVPLLVLAHLVLAIVAAVRANNGEIYRYPLTFRLIQ